MTVNELIEKLKEMPKEMKVRTEAGQITSVKMVNLWAGRIEVQLD